MTDEPRVIEPGENLFEVFGLPDPEEANLKSRLAIAIGALIDRRGLSQAAAAAQMGIAQPDVCNILHGRLREFSVERLLECIAALGENVTILIGSPLPRRRALAEPGKLRVVEVSRIRGGLARRVAASLRPHAPEG